MIEESNTSNQMIDTVLNVIGCIGSIKYACYCNYGINGVRIHQSLFIPNAPHPPTERGFPIDEIDEISAVCQALHYCKRLTKFQIVLLRSVPVIKSPARKAH